MTSIEPRFRGHYPATDEQNDDLCPILAIPDWEAQAVSNVSLNSIEAATAASPAEATDAADWNHVANEQLSGDDGPAAGRLRETTEKDWSISKFRKRLRLTSALPNTVRGVLPGVGIAISLMFLWTVFQKDQTPQNQGVLSRDVPKAVKPIDQEPLRAASPTSVATQTPTTNSPVVATNDNESVDPLFNQVPIIASESADDFATTDTDPAAADDFADAKSLLNPQDNTAEATLTREAPGQIGVGMVNNSGQTSATGSKSEPSVSDPTRQNVGLVNSLTAPSQRANTSAPNSMTDKAFFSNSPDVARQQPPSGSARGTLNNPPGANSRYSYESTDPSTFKDPIYNIPPIARRQTRTSDAQPYSATPQANNGETTGRSRR